MHNKILDFTRLESEYVLYINIEFFKYVRYWKSLKMLKKRLNLTWEKL